MIASVFPALRKFSREASIIGELLTGYTSLEYQLCICVGMGGDDVAGAIADIFSKRGETRRVQIADRLGGKAYAAAGLGTEFDTVIEDIFLCLKIRNKYAHCIWHDNHTGRLAFAQMEEIAAPPNHRIPDTINLTFHYLDVSLLEAQAAFFLFTNDNINYLNYKRRQLVGDIGPGAKLRLPSPVPRPRMHL